MNARKAIPKRGRLLIRNTKFWKFNKIIPRCYVSLIRKNDFSQYQLVGIVLNPKKNSSFVVVVFISNIILV